MSQPEQKDFASLQGDLCYFEWGEAGEGPSILLLHATGFHARCWDKVVAAFPKETHVVAVDQLGHGRSAKPEITDWAIIAGATTELVQSLGIKFAVAAGHSMGGHCLVQTAAALPDQIARLVLVDPVIMNREAYQNPPDYSATNHMVSKRRNSWAAPDEMFDRFKDRRPTACGTLRCCAIIANMDCSLMEKEATSLLVRRKPRLRFMQQVHRLIPGH
ncbi:alpha/beta fold hydrolase [Parasphingorhabdus halotolerans]|uniref:Alpha/beta hydrolase n=1 Tax=Parasphingorhabdus halotolerans TaxID=2725558 RepID=A0A6H2DQ92_9SPHN|nr:alpha/beta hydrolase [Parasphingorhabdus halotolerans]QJB70560.1 alpha/beta hydrolase [Parasphingorhabdus halotolerans]